MKMNYKFCVSLHRYFLIYMDSLSLLRVIFSFLPFLMSLFWLIIFVAQYRESDGAKQMLTMHIAACTVLYFCHALFFTVGLSYEMECVWTLCSLSVYPLFYGYLSRLTSSSFTFRQMLPYLFPGIAIALAKYLFPNAGIDAARLLLFAVQVVFVCYFGIRKLRAFDCLLQSFYADTEGRETSNVSRLLVAVICVSLLSAVANSLGRQFFGESLYLLVPISLAFSVTLFALNYICFSRTFTVEELEKESVEGEQDESISVEDDATIGRKLETLMSDRQYYLTKNLKISDVVKQIGSNRTYVSNYINTNYNCSFSDYINRKRIDFAKTILLSSTEDVKLSTIADSSGFSSESSFYRNFQKIVGMTPNEFKMKESSKGKG